MKCLDLFSLKIRKKKSKLSAAVVIDVSRVKTQPIAGYPDLLYTTSISFKKMKPSLHFIAHNKY